MTIFRVNHNKNYTVINNTICKDKRISWKAKGIWLYAFSRPDNWSFNIENLINMSTDGRDAVTSGLKELESCGYLKRERIRNADGTLAKGAIWDFYETPQEIKEFLPETENPNLDISSLEKPPLLSTDSLINIEATATKEDEPKEKAAAASSQLKDCPLSDSEKQHLISQFNEEELAYINQLAAAKVSEGFKPKLSWQSYLAGAVRSQPRYIIPELKQKQSIDLEKIEAKRLNDQQIWEQSKKRHEELMKQDEQSY
jgi:hypothetical protein